jgi:hypothetical protein
VLFKGCTAALHLATINSFHRIPNENLQIHFANVQAFDDPKNAPFIGSFVSQRLGWSPIVRTEISSFWQTKDSQWIQFFGTKIFHRNLSKF